MFKLKSVFLFIVMTFFTKNVVLSPIGYIDDVSDLSDQSHNKEYGRKNTASKKKKKPSKKSIGVPAQQTQSLLSDSIDQRLMQFSLIFEEGKNYIDQFSGSETKFDNAIQVGDYYLKVPDGITLKEANSIVKNKLSLLLSMIMMATFNKYFDFGHASNCSCALYSYYDPIMMNRDKIAIAIINSKFFVLSESPEMKKFIKSVIMLQLKTLLYPKIKESNCGFSLPEKFVNPQIKEFLKNNNILAEVGALKKIRKKLGLNEEDVYLLAAMAYYVKDNNDIFLYSSFFHEIVIALTFPLNSKFLRIDHSGQKEMRAIYKTILQFYDIDKICGVEEQLIP